MKRHTVLAVFLSLLVTACARTKAIRVTDNNQDEVLQKVAQSKDLSSEEKQMVLAFFVRSKMGGMFGIEKAKPADKTVGEIIQEQEAWVAKETERDEKEKQLALQEKAKEEVMIAELRRCVSVVPYDLKPRESGFLGGMDLKYVVTNAAQKDIRAFQGRLIVTDILGEEVADIEVKSLQTLKLGEKRNDADFLPFMAYASLRGKKYEDLKFQWKPKTIILLDGSTLGEPPKADKE